MGWGLQSWSYFLAPRSFISTHFPFLSFPLTFPSPLLFLALFFRFPFCPPLTLLLPFPSFPLLSLLLSSPSPLFLPLLSPLTSSPLPSFPFLFFPHPFLFPSFPLFLIPCPSSPFLFSVLFFFLGFGTILGGAWGYPYLVLRDHSSMCFGG